MTHEDHHPSGMPAHVVFHLGESMGQLSERIARLSIALGVSLHKDADMARVMSQPQHLGEGQNASERRQSGRWRELRALLVLRYGLQKRCLDDAGAGVTRQMLSAHQDRMQRDGFKAGADGFHLSRMFED